MIDSAHLTVTRTSYDEVSALYAERFGDMLRDRPLDRGLLAAFAELVSGGPVADLGCGPGYLTAHLRSLGLDAFGVDLSPEMIRLAREAYPGMRFEVGELSALDLAGESVGGVLSHWSIIHTPPAGVPAIFAEFGRVLAPGGHLLVCFAGHDDPGAPPEPYDHAVTTAYRWSPDQVSALLAEAGLTEVARLVHAGAEDPKRGFPAVNLVARKAARP
ncbi:class I SAM-dependent DNA methyltransferase [Nonomuraea sp. NPDC050663]|uniref:class I SAM-dependent DNA methyltransferase n=1 Tax=Nonomuraea sp. NPDC050663 TaxID=3364370 RepID=UPI00378BFACF